jgi:osmoprotectant transport system ATP-binding protein
MHASIHELSGGMKQRVALARALAPNPRVLLMDEPFAAVDAIVRASLQDEIARVHRELGTTIVFVTHDVDEALRLADRIVVMNAGHVVQNGSPTEVLEHPADDFVRDLVGVDAETRRLALERPLIQR